MPESERGRQAAAMAALSTVIDLALAGNCQEARELCSTVIFESQPLIAADAELLRITLYALFLCRGFKMLSRLVMAVSGTDVLVKVMPDDEGYGAPPRRTRTAGRVVYFVDAKWLVQLSPNDIFLETWSRALVGERHDRPMGMVDHSRHLELA